VTTGADDSPTSSDALEAVIGRRWTLRLLAQTTLRHLGNAPLSELEELLPRPLARRLFASVQLGRDLVTLPRPRALENTEDAFRLVRPLLEGRETERFVAIACDSRFRPLATDVVAEGTPVGVAVRIADVFAPAIRHRAPHLLVAHNHPSDDPTPSGPDLVLTRRLAELGEVLGVALVDHIIVAGARFASVRECVPWDSPAEMPVLHDAHCLDRSFVDWSR
jgi:DNA repair protein RadC